MARMKDWRTWLGSKDGNSAHKYAGNSLPSTVSGSNDHPKPSNVSLKTTHLGRLESSRWVYSTAVNQRGVQEERSWLPSSPAKALQSPALHGRSSTDLASAAPTTSSSSTPHHHFMSYAPDETAEQIYAEGTWLQGAIVTAVLYGVVVVLFVMCFRSLWSQIRVREAGYKKNIFFLCYVTFVFIIGTVYVASNSEITQLGFINNRNYPGGPSAFEENTSSPPLNVAFVLSNWCADFLLIWRCTVVYKDTRYHTVITAFGGILFLASVVTGSLWVIIVSRPEQSGSGWMSFTFLFPYLSVSLAINILISLLTVIRLMYHRSRISRVLGPAYGKIYASFAGMIIESASVYSICSLLYLIPYAVNSSVANAFMQILGEAQIIAPLLIIYRVSEGKAWSEEYSARAVSSNSMRMRHVPDHRPAVNASSHPQSNTLNNVESKVTFDITRHPGDSIKFEKAETNAV